MKIKLDLDSIVLVLLVAVVGLTACVPTNRKLEAGKLTDYDLYNKNKPDAGVADTGMPSGNLITTGIAKAYKQTIELEKSYITRIENNKVAAILEAIRLEQGEAAYKKAFSELSAEDKKAYKTFLDSNINELAVASEYATAASSMARGIMHFNYREYNFDFLSMTKVMAAVLKATQQIAYTEKALEFMVKTHDIYQKMLTYQGR